MNLYNLYSRPEELDLYAELGPHMDDQGTATWRNARGEIHQDGDLPAVIQADGIQAWYQQGKRHRVAGPAVIYPNGARLWYQNGKLHRVGGPAIYNLKNKYEEWWRNGTQINVTEIPQKQRDAWEKKKRAGKADEESI